MAVEAVLWECRACHEQVTISTQDADVHAVWVAQHLDPVVVRLYAAADCPCG